MRLLWLLIGFMLCFYIAKANNIIAYEYWYNDTHQNRTYVQLNEPILSFSLSLEIDTPILSNAINTIYIRVLDSIGNWSAISSWQFLKPLQPVPTPSGEALTDNGITKYEYWFNYDRSTKQTAILSGDLNHTDSFNIDVDALNDGINTLHFRYEDSSGYRSAISSWQFLKPLQPVPTPSGEALTDNGITKYEYWFNYDRSTKQTAILSGDLNHTDSFNIDIDALNDGINTLHFRYEDSSGYRSVVSSWQFLKPLPPLPTPSGEDLTDNKMTKFEYWFNGDYANKSESYFNPSRSLDLNHDIILPKLPIGENNMFIRFKDSAGYYTVLQSELLVIEGDTLQIFLLSGWNLISTYVEPEIAALENIFSEIESSTVIVKNNTGQIYYPEFDINDIGDWDVKQGYQVYMSKAETLTIPGFQVVPETTEITLTTGWNILAYLRDSPMDIELALASLVADDNLVIAKDNFGNVFYPAFDINMIGDMLPGQGYQIYMLSGATLVYPEN